MRIQDITKKKTKLQIIEKNKYNFYNMIFKKNFFEKKKQIQNGFQNSHVKM